MSLIKVFVLFISICVSIEAIAQDKEIILKDMASNHRMIFKKNTKGVRTLFLISSHCTVCRRQLKNIGCFEELGEVMVIALKGSKEDLLREKSRTQLNKEIYMAHDELINELQLESLATPQIMIEKNGRRYLGLGFHSCSSKRVTDFLEDKSLKS